MISFLEPDTDAVAWGREEAEQWYNFSPAFNNISGGAQISKHRDLLGTPQFIRQPGLGQREQIHHPSSVKKSFTNTGKTQPFCCAPTMPSS